MKTLQDLFNTEVKRRNGDYFIPDFRVAVQGKMECGGIHVIIHASGYKSDTLNFIVKENELIPFQGVMPR